MILNKLKYKSIQRRIKKLLAERTLVASSKPLENVLVLVNVDEFGKINQLRSFAKTLNVSEKNLTVIGFSNSKKTIKTHVGLLFTLSKLGWKGAIKDNEINAILKQPYDLLINYFNENNIALSALSANTNVKFRVGFPNANSGLNDLIIDCDVTDVGLFESEMIKYLKVLNKL